MNLAIQTNKHIYSAIKQSTLLLAYKYTISSVKNTEHVKIYLHTHTHIHTHIYIYKQRACVVKTDNWKNVTLKIYLFAQFGSEEIYLERFKVSFFTV